MSFQKFYTVIFIFIVLAENSYGAKIDQIKKSRKKISELTAAMGSLELRSRQKDSLQDASEEVVDENDEIKRHSQMLQEAYDSAGLPKKGLTNILDDFRTWLLEIEKHGFYISCNEFKRKIKEFVSYNIMQGNDKQILACWASCMRDSENRVALITNLLVVLVSSQHQRGKNQKKVRKATFACGKKDHWAYDDKPVIEPLSEIESAERAGRNRYKKARQRCKKSFKECEILLQDINEKLKREKEIQERVATIKNKGNRWLAIASGGATAQELEEY